jgi:hypothetical protein
MTRCPLNNSPPDQSPKHHSIPVINPGFLFIILLILNQNTPGAGNKIQPMESALPAVAVTINLNFNQTTAGFENDTVIPH